jgi:hypothetical protein
MPLTTQMKQTIGHDSSEVRSPLGAALRKDVHKAAGTRAGILQDWRRLAGESHAPSHVETSRRTLIKRRCHHAEVVRWAASS